MKIDFDRLGEKCANCKRAYGNHKSETFNCPSGRGKATWFLPNQFFMEKKNANIRKSRTSRK